MRGRNEGSIYRRRRDGRWMAAVSMPNGTRRQKLAPKAENDRAGARRVLASLLDDREAAASPTATSRLGPFLRRWLDEVRPSLRPSTFRGYEMTVRVHLEPALGGYPLAKLTVPIVQEYLRRKGERVSAQTVGHHRAILRAALAVAIEWGILRRNVATLAHPPRVERLEIRVLTAEQVRELLAATIDDRLHALWSLAATTGMRQAELLGLRWGDLDLDAASLRVERTLARIAGQWVLVEPKTRQSRRTIPIVPAAVSALRAHRRRQAEERLAAGVGGERDTLVFTTQRGQPLQGAEVLRRLRAALARAGLPRLRFHDLRHGTASILLAEGYSLEDVKHLLGHSTIALTSNTYGHYLERRGREVAAGMAKAIGGGA